MHMQGNYFYLDFEKILAFLSIICLVAWGRDYHHSICGQTIYGLIAVTFNLSPVSC